jgi:hypothetical protein
VNSQTRTYFSRLARLEGQDDPCNHHTQLAVVADFGRILYRDEAMVDSFEQLRLYHYSKALGFLREFIRNMDSASIPQDRLINTVFNLMFVDREWDRRMSREYHAASPVMKSRIHASRGRKPPGTRHEDALQRLVRAKGGLAAMDRSYVAEMIWA